MSLRESGCHRAVIMEVGLSSCHQPVYSAGCTANTSNVKTASIFPERTETQNSFKSVNFLVWYLNSAGLGAAGGAAASLAWTGWISSCDFHRNGALMEPPRSDIWEASGPRQTEQLAADRRRGSCNERWRLVTRRACHVVLHRVTGPHRPPVSHCFVIMFSSQLVSVQVRWKHVGDIKFVILAPLHPEQDGDGRWNHVSSSAVRNNKTVQSQNTWSPTCSQSHNLLQQQLQVKHRSK